ncbi:Ig-like domain-containing protein [Roseibacterium beibuensis]|uniref:beta strand repeat-containing protein n=1 Tax=[Roseibacterium] beibuensis TaxID=1193142 RepID=UPI00217DE9E5|nr:Ig-like domain-containing protein [Roseibacterium beibuensis]MCS6622546.1 Ig-like domain-containing protein [Roseibacterium beibuensis]
MPITTPFVVSPFDSGDNDIRPSMTRLPNGNIVVVYEHYNGVESSLAIRVLQPDGTPVTAEIFDTIGGYGALPRVVAIDDTHFAIVASDFGTVSGAVELTAQVFTIDGANLTQGGELPISNYASTNDDNGNDHQILRLPDGNFLVVWAQYTNGFGNAQLVARTFDADFNPLTPETRISEFNNTGVSNPQVSLDGYNAVVSWNQNDPTTGGSIHARVAAFTVGADGSLPGSPPNDIDVGNHTGVRSITHLANGDVLVLYVGGPTQGGALDDNDKLTAKIYSSDLSKVKATLQVNPTVDDNGVSSVTVVAFASGGFQVIWGQDPAGGTNPSQDFELYSRAYNLDYVATGLPTLLTDNAVADTSPVAVVDADGNVTVTWETTNASGSGSIVGLYLEDQDPGLPNQEPVGADHTATVAEDGPHTFAASEFGFSDPDGDAFASVVFTTLPANGVIVVVDEDGVVVQTLTAGQSVTAAQLAAGLVQYRPDANESGDDFDTFTFQVQDDGGTDAGGVNRDQTPNTFTFDVTAVNDAPTVSLTSTDGSFTENGSDVGLFSGSSVANPESGEELTLTFSISGVVDGSSERLMLSGVPIDLVAGSPFIQPAPGGAVMAQVTATATPGVFTLVIVGVSSNSHAQQILDAITYRNDSEAPTEGDRLITLVSIRDNGGGSNSTTVNQTTTVTVVAVDDAAVAVNDSNSTVESAPVSGSVFGNDSDVDGPALAVSAVNGSAASVGVEITLASGALLTLNEDGTYTYDPNGAFDALSGPTSGGSNQTGADSFTYTLENGNTATVTITLTGEDSDGDVLRGGSGNDALVGGAGVDTADYSAAGAGVRVQLNTGLASDGDGGTDTLTDIENLTGSAFDDVLIGNGVDSVLNGGLGSDTLVGLGGDDTLIGGMGAANQMQGGLGDDVYIVEANDTVVEFLNEGTDEIRTGRSTQTLAANVEILTYTGAGAFTGTGNILDNTLTGGAGDDLLAGGAGSDVLQGGAGSDTADYYLAAGGVTADVESGASNDGDGGVDTYVSIENLRGSSFADVLYGAAGSNVLDGGDGNDTLVGRGGNDSLRGGSGTDTADYGDAASGVSVFLNSGVASDGDGGVDALVSVENITGSAHGDLIAGSDGANVLAGGAGQDTLLGLGGDDILMGGSGAANQLQGGTGNDRYILDAFDTCVEFAGEGTDTVEARVGTYTLGAHIENLLYTGAGVFVGSGNALNNTITGGALNDILRGGGGDDVIDGGLGTDEVQLRGVSSDYTITAEGSGWRIVDSVGGRDGSTFVTSIEVLRYADNTTTVLAYPPAAPAGPESVAKDGQAAQVLPGLTFDKAGDAFVLPALPDDEPLILPGLEALKAGDEPSILPGAHERAPLFADLDARLAAGGDRPLTLDADGRLMDQPAHRDIDWMG